MHENCNFYVENGSILCRANPGVMLDEDITILIDIEDGVLLKVGRRDWVTDYFNVICGRYADLKMPELSDSLKLITFGMEDEYTDHDAFIHRICTIINWFGNSIGERMKWFLELPLEEAEAQVRKLQEIGF